MNKSGMLPIAIIVLVVLLFVGLFFIKITGYSIFGETREHDVLANQISGLKSIELDNIDTAEKYIDFVNNVNDLTNIINKQTGAKIPELEATNEAWSKASKTIAKYGPLINNYNSLIISAQKYQLDKSEENYEIFYKNLSVFSLEFTFISATLIHTATFELVGGVYRAIGLNSLALKCPSCVTAILSSTYWGIKTVLVEEASNGADFIFNKFGDIFKK